VGDAGPHPERHPVEGDLGGEGLLRQGRPVVGRVRLVADDDDLPGVAGGAQLLGGPQPAERRAGDADPPHRRSSRRSAMVMAWSGQTSAASSTASRRESSVSLSYSRCPSSLIRKTSGAEKTHCPWSWQTSMSTMTFMSLPPRGADAAE